MYYIHTHYGLKEKTLNTVSNPGLVICSCRVPNLVAFMWQGHDMRSSFEIHPVPNPSFLLVISYLRCIPLHGW